MLNTLIESLIIEALENKLNLDNEIDYIYSTLDKSQTLKKSYKILE